MQSPLGPGDEVVTIGGLYGTVTGVDDETVTARGRARRADPVRPSGHRPGGQPGRAPEAETITEDAEPSRSDRSPRTGSGLDSHKWIVGSAPDAGTLAPSRATPPRRDAGTACRPSASTRQSTSAGTTGPTRRRCTSGATVQGDRTAVAPPQGQMRPGRQLAVLGLIFVVLYLLVFFAGGASGGCEGPVAPQAGPGPGRRHPGDAGGDQHVDGKPPTAENLERGPADHREPGQRASAWPRPRWSPRATATSSSPCPARTADLDRRRQRRRAALPQGAQGAPTAAARPPRRPGRHADPVAAARLRPRPAAPRRPPSGSASAEGDRQPRARRPRRGGHRRPGRHGPDADAATPAGLAERRRAARRAPARPPVPPSVEQQRKAVEQKVGAAAWRPRPACRRPADLTADPPLAEKLKPFGTLSAAGGRGAAGADAVQRADHHLRAARQAPAGVDQRREPAGGLLRGRRHEVPARQGQGAGHRRRATPPRCSTRQRQWVVSLELHRRRPGASGPT